MTSTPKSILVIRNDKLGDFCLALPCFALLKQCLPETRLIALVPSYTQEIAQMSPNIDQVLIDPGASTSKGAQHTLLQQLKTLQIDAVLTLFSTTRIGWLLWRSGIRARFAPATKIAQLFHNHRLRQRRSRSLKPEFEYNLDLTRAMLEHFKVPLAPVPGPPYLAIDQTQVDSLRRQFVEEHGLSHQGLYVFLHPGHGGSATNLNIEQYAALANSITCEHGLSFIVSAGPGERDQARAVVERIERHPVCLYESRAGLSSFVQHIAFADLFIGGSTGPLHIAGALNRPTAGFYPNRRSATSLRWQTLSSDDRRMAFSPPLSAGAEDMSQIDIESAARTISETLGRLKPQNSSA